MPNQVEIGARIKAYRKKAGLTQGDIASALGKDTSGISKLEAGLVSLNTDDAVRIAGMIGCTLDALLYGSDEPLEGEVAETVDAVEQIDSISLIVRRAQRAVSDKVGFSVSPEQALEFMARKAEIYDVVFPGRQKIRVS